MEIETGIIHTNHVTLIEDTQVETKTIEIIAQIKDTIMTPGVVRDHGDGIGTDHKAEVINSDVIEASPADPLVELTVTERIVPGVMTTQDVARTSHPLRKR